MKRFGNFLTCLIIDSFESGTSSINDSSTKTIVDFFFEVCIIFNNLPFESNSPVGLFGLQTKTHPFFGIFCTKSSRSFARFIVLKKRIFEPASFAAASYSPKVGIGINTEVFLFKNA